MLKFIKNESGYALQGSLNYDSVSDLIHQRLALADFESNHVDINCQQLDRIDSAGIALFIQWQRECESNNKTLRFLNLSLQVTSLLKANQLDGFLVT